MTGEQARTAARRGQRRRPQQNKHRGLRGALSAEVAVVALVAGIVLARAGIVDHRFPGYVSGHDHSVITAYSGPYVAAAVGLGALAGLLLIAAGLDWWRAWCERPPGPARSHTGLGQ